VVECSLAESFLEGIFLKVYHEKGVGKVIIIRFIHIQERSSETFPRSRIMTVTAAKVRCLGPQAF